MDVRDRGQANAHDAAVPRRRGTRATGTIGILPGLPAAVAAVAVAFLLVQATLGWGLGVFGAGVTVLVAVAILGMVVVTDSLDGGSRPQSNLQYDVVVCAVVAAAVALLVACLYLPEPWGGLCAAMVLTGLVAALRLR
jgi:hypothetical protein